MQIPSSSSTLPYSAPLPVPAAAPTTSDPTGQVPPGADESAQTAAPLNATPRQFSTAMMFDLLNASEGGDQYIPLQKAAIGANGLPQLSATVPAWATNPNAPHTEVGSYVDLPNGMDLGIFDPAQATQAAQEVVGTFGTDGEISLTGFEQAIGLPTVSSDPHSSTAALAADWQRLAGSSSATLSAVQLTSAIQAFLKAQGAGGETSPAAGVTA